MARSALALLLAAPLALAVPAHLPHRRMHIPPHNPSVRPVGGRATPVALVSKEGDSSAWWHLPEGKAGHPGTACQSWCNTSVTVDGHGATELGYLKETTGQVARKHYPSKKVADWPEKCSWDLLCAGCGVCSTLGTRMCEDWCYNTVEPWYVVCNWGSCHGCGECGTEQALPPDDADVSAAVSSPPPSSPSPTPVQTRDPATESNAPPAAAQAGVPPAAAQAGAPPAAATPAAVSPPPPPAPLRTPRVGRPSKALANFIARLGLPADAAAELHEIFASVKQEANESAWTSCMRDGIHRNGNTTVATK